MSTPTAVPPLTVREYAWACGDWMAVSETIRPGIPGERDMREWVQSANELTPPPELVEFHEARVGTYSKQFGTDGETIGPNAEAQAAYQREVELVDAMSPDVRRVLIDGWCLTEEDVLSGRRRLEALARADAIANMEPGTVTVAMYALACADVTRTTPHFDDSAAVYDHYVEKWTALEPPAEVEEYHAAVLEVFLDSQETQIIDLESPAMLAAMREALNLPPNVMDALRFEGCVGNQPFFSVP